MERKAHSRTARELTVFSHNQIGYTLDTVFWPRLHAHHKKEFQSSPHGAAKRRSGIA